MIISSADENTQTLFRCPPDQPNQSIPRCLKVLLGKKTNEGSGKILRTGPNDYVFIYFSDHGAVGLVAFPDEVLHAKTFIKTLKEMHSRVGFS